MNNREAFKRAKRALEKAHEGTNNFDHGGWDSWSIVEHIERCLAVEFRQADADTKRLVRETEELGEEAPMTEPS